MNGKRSEILGNIGVALNANDLDEISKLVESAFDVGCTVEEIKKAARGCIARPDFDVICEFCGAMRFEENTLDVLKIRDWFKKYQHLTSQLKKKHLKEIGKNWDAILFQQRFICKRSDKRAMKEIYADTGVHILCKNFSMKDEPYCELVNGRCYKFYLTH